MVEQATARSCATKPPPSGARRRSGQRSVLNPAHNLAAERCAPEETHARPATKSLIAGLLVFGPTSTELRGLAERSGVLA